MLKAPKWREVNFRANGGYFGGQIVILDSCITVVSDISKPNASGVLLAKECWRSVLSESVVEAHQMKIRKGTCYELLLE